MGKIQAANPFSLEIGRQKCSLENGLNEFNSLGRYASVRMNDTVASVATDTISTELAVFSESDVVLLVLAIQERVGHLGMLFAKVKDLSHPYDSGSHKRKDFCIVMTEMQNKKPCTVREVNHCINSLLETLNAVTATANELCASIAKSSKRKLDAQNALDVVDGKLIELNTGGARAKLPMDICNYLLNNHISVSNGGGVIGPSSKLSKNELKVIKAHVNYEVTCATDRFSQLQLQMRELTRFYGEIAPRVNDCQVILSRINKECSLRLGLPKTDKPTLVD